MNMKLSSSLNHTDDFIVPLFDWLGFTKKTNSGNKSSTHLRKETINFSGPSSQVNAKDSKRPMPYVDYVIVHRMDTAHFRHIGWNNSNSKQSWDTEICHK